MPDTDGDGLSGGTGLCLIAADGTTQQTDREC